MIIFQSDSMDNISHFSPFQRMKTANFYKSRHSELDKSLLTVIPDAPRVPQPGLPSNYDWSMFDESAQNSSSSNVRIRSSFTRSRFLKIDFSHFAQSHFLKKSYSTYESFIKLREEDERHKSTIELSSIHNALETDE